MNSRVSESVQADQDLCPTFPGLGPDLTMSVPSRGHVGRELGPTWLGMDPDFGKSVPSRDQVDQDSDPTWPELGPTWPCRGRVEIESVGTLAGLGHESGADLAKSGPIQPQLGPDLARTWAPFFSRDARPFVDLHLTIC